MIGKFASGWMLLMLGTAVPAGAQELAGSMEEFTAAATFETADDGSANRDRGVRQTQTSAFTLLEHGRWQREATDVLISAPSVGLPSSLGAGTGSSLRPRASSFARTTWLPWVYAAENRHGLPLGLLDALIWTESRYNSLARSNAGAVGLAQLMPGTAGDLGVANRYDPVASIEGGARYLRQMLDRFGSVYLAVAAYNAGPGAVARARGIPLNGETPNYVRNVLGRWRSR